MLRVSFLTSPPWNIAHWPWRHSSSEWSTWAGSFLMTIPQCLSGDLDEFDGLSEVGRCVSLCPRSRFFCTFLSPFMCLLAEDLHQLAATTACVTSSGRNGYFLTPEHVRQGHVAHEPMPCGALRWPINLGVLNAAARISGTVGLPNSV